MKTKKLLLKYLTPYLLRYSVAFPDKATYLFILIVVSYLIVGLITFLAVLLFNDVILNVYAENVMLMSQNAQSGSYTEADIHISHENQASLHESRGHDIRANGDLSPQDKWYSVSFISNYNSIVNKAKRRLYWDLVEAERKNYDSYKDFKAN